MKAASITGPLPTGTSVLEASAGTGKTWTIAGLVARYVAETDLDVSQLLVVTFGRAATSELRTRVRERLVSVAAALRSGVSDDDPVVDLLLQGDVPLHVRRLDRALASFDSATVATTHGFCEQVLRSLGVLSDLDPGTVLVETLDDLRNEVVDDLYLAFARKQPLPFTLKDARKVAREAINHPSAELLPTGAAKDSVGDLRQRFAVQVRKEVERRKRALRLLCFDDQLERVRRALMDPATGAAACERLRERFSVVLVDEFQDTDPVQWDVLRAAFHQHRTLIVIGDPKQAIYAFRGADVRAYIAAKEEAREPETLGTNWRSDRKVLDGLKVLLRGAALGDPEIVVESVEAGYSTVALGPEPDDQPVRLRVVPDVQRTVGPARDIVASDVAAQVVALLQEGRTITPRGSADARPLNERDVAVLVRTGVQAARIRDALQDVNVPCVLSGTFSVFGTQAASDWVVLLEALEQPQNRGRVRRCALTALVGRSAEELDGAAGVELADSLAQTLRSWAEVLAERGIAGLFAVISEERRLAERLLSRYDGERLLTDLRHVSEIVHRQGIEGQLGLAGLVSWLRDRIADTSDSNQERSRRLDTERSAVQVLTVHVSKGLEFPVVLVPFGWDIGSGSSEQYPRGHDAAGHRTLFVGGRTAPGYDEACVDAATEDAGEELRLLYVAMTRAVSRLVVWWCFSERNSPRSPLHRLLFCDNPLEIPERIPVRRDPVARLRALCEPTVRVEEVSSGSVAPLAPAAVAALDLSPARFDRSLDLMWRRTSYSGITRDVHETGPSVASEAEVSVKDDEPDVVDETVADDSPLRDIPSLWADLKGGAWFGTMVHEVLEKADLAPDPSAALLDALSWHVEPQPLVDALLPAVRTPLGDLAGGLSLVEVPRSDQLRELDFELPLAGGDSPVGGAVSLAGLASLLRTHLPAGDPVLPYADVLEHSGLTTQQLRGYLAGSIDVVLRVDGRYLVADHKTNRLAPAGEPLTAWHYRREAMDSAMLAAHYPLQALLYCVALHRYLRWRLPSYDPASHLGGVLYLFLRGMCGPGVDAGVWSWQPPAALVSGLSDLLAGVSS